MKNVSEIKKALSKFHWNKDMPILKSILFKSGNAIVTNFDTTLIIKDAYMGEDFCLQKKALDMFDGSHFENYHIVDNNISIGDFEFRLENMEIFPIIPEPYYCKDDMFSIGKKQIESIINASEFVATNKNRPAMCRVAFNNLGAMSSNGHIIFWNQTNCETFIDAESVNLLKLSNEWNVIKIENKDTALTVFDCDEYSIYHKHQTGLHFPKFYKVLDKIPTSVFEVKANTMLKALKRMSKIANKNNDYVDMYDKLTIADREVGSLSIDIGIAYNAPVRYRYEHLKKIFNTFNPDDVIQVRRFDNNNDNMTIFANDWHNVLVMDIQRRS